MTLSPLLIKALALALAASQILVSNDVRTSFDGQTERAQVLQIMQQGCQKIRATATADFPALHKLLQMDPDTALDSMIANATTLGQSLEIFPGLQMSDAKLAYDIFCKASATGEADQGLIDVISYYNSTLHDLPAERTLVDYKLPEFSTVFDASGSHFTDIYKASRRQPVTLSDIPEALQKAVIAAEDKHFYEHHGIDEHGLLRAGMGTVTGQEGKHDQGGSTITQQLVKNLLLDSTVTYERKLREMVLANKIEHYLSKGQILSLYLNYVYLGRDSWGVKSAALSWFGKPLEQLSLTEIAFLAGMPKGPRAYNPILHPGLSADRTAYVLKQMHDDGFIDDGSYQLAVSGIATMKYADFKSPVATTGLYFAGELEYSIKHQLDLDPGQVPLVIHSTLNFELQNQVEASLQEGLVQYELHSGRERFNHSEGNVADQVAQATKAGASVPPPWLTALINHPSTPDIHWPLAVLLPPDKTGLHVGLSDGRVLRLRLADFARKSLKPYDLIFIQPEGKDLASLRYRPEVEGAALVLENKTGRVLAMAGGFSFSSSQLNRTVHMVRSPGSTVKPMTYLAALHAGVQPNTLVEESSISLGDPTKPFSPRSDCSTNGGSVITMRYGLEHSCNQATTRLLTMFEDHPEHALKDVVELFRECGISEDPKEYWSIILGGLDTSLLNMATCYATIANGGLKPHAHLFDSVERDGQILPVPNPQPLAMSSADPVAVYQLRTLMQGVVVRGTASALNTNLADVIKKVDKNANLGDFVAGKTGTSNSSTDAWFIGFTNEVTIALWVGYDNARLNTRRTLGEGDGAAVAAPIWAQVFRDVIGHFPLTRLRPPPPAAAAHLYPVLVSTASGDYGRQVSSDHADNYSIITEFMRTDGKGLPIDTREKFFTEPPPPVAPTPTESTDSPPPTDQDNNQ
jgi:penicillin-binding protein 1A